MRPRPSRALATSARGGVRAGLAAAFGVAVGSLGWAVLTAGGLAALLAASEHALTVIRTIGGVYLLFLAYKTFRERRVFKEAQGRTNIWRAFRAGAMTNLFNPKVGLFYLAFLPGFTSDAIGPIWIQILVLGAVFSVTGGLVLAATAVAAGAARSLLLQSEKFRVGLNTTAAAVFAGLGLHLVFARSE